MKKYLFAIRNIERTFDGFRTTVEVFFVSTNKYKELEEITLEKESTMEGSLGLFSFKMHKEKSGWGMEPEGEFIKCMDIYHDFDEKEFQKLNPGLRNKWSIACLIDGKVIPQLISKFNEAYENAGKKIKEKVKDYPYVIFRAMASVYLKRPVIFKAKKDQVVSNTNQIIVIDSNPYDKKGKLTQKARNQIIQETLKIAKESSHRMCAVFGKKDCVYCEPNGSTTPSNDLPRTTFKIGGKDVDVTDVLSDRLQS